MNYLRICTSTGSLCPHYVNGLAMGLRVTEYSVLRISVLGVEQHQVFHPEITL